MKLIFFLKNRKCESGLVLHPDNQHLLYPLGSVIVVRNVIERKNSTLEGHDNEVSCLTISKNGQYVKLYFEKRFLKINKKFFYVNKKMKCSNCMYFQGGKVARPRTQDSPRTFSSGILRTAPSFTALLCIHYILENKRFLHFYFYYIEKTFFGDKKYFFVFKISKKH